MKQKKVFALDYDGVICDSLEPNIDAANEACKKIGISQRITKDDVEQTDNMTFEALAQKAGIDRDLVPQFIELTYSCIDKSVKRMKFFPSMMNAIPQLSDVCCLAVVTCNDEEVVRNSLDKAGLLEYFPIILGNETRSKAEKLTELALNYKVTPDQVYMIGDCVSDILQARSANVKSVAATWGFHCRQTLLDQNPDFLADSPSQLLAIANDLCPHSQSYVYEDAI